jgi:hypothetical protein
MVKHKGKTEVKAKPVATEKFADLPAATRAEIAVNAVLPSGSVLPDPPDVEAPDSVSVSTPPEQGQGPSSTEVQAFAISMFKTGSEGWSVLGLNLVITPNGPEILSWENLAEESFVPKTHADVLMKVNVARRFLFPGLLYK